FTMSSFGLCNGALRKFNILTTRWEKWSLQKLCGVWIQPASHRKFVNVPYPRAAIDKSSLGVDYYIKPIAFLFTPLRHKSRKSFKKDARRKVQKEEDVEDEDEEEDNDPEKSDYEDAPEDDPHVPKDYRDLEKAVQSFRYDVVLKAGLDIARNKIEDAFYNNKLRLNGEKLLKKSKTVKVGDALDIIVEEDKEAETIMVMRVVLKKISEEVTETEKYRVLLRRWKNLKLPKQQMLTACR
uniref:Mitochondrial transcription rescue factor 1 n=1 Tax=Latimeria chalumnae TaxID=7897 RepID=H3AET3_LATCH